jgi:hypothetical protein
MPIPADARHPHHITSNDDPKTSMIRYDNTAKTAGVPANPPSAVTNPTPTLRKDEMSASDLRPWLSLPPKIQSIARVETAVSVSRRIRSIGFALTSESERQYEYRRYQIEDHVY